MLRFSTDIKSVFNYTYILGSNLPWWALNFGLQWWLAKQLLTLSKPHWVQLASIRYDFLIFFLRFSVFWLPSSSIASLWICNFFAALFLTLTIIMLCDIGQILHSFIWTDTEIDYTFLLVGYFRCLLTTLVMWLSLTMEQLYLECWK